MQEGVCSSHRSRMKIRWEPYSYDECLGCMYLVVKVHASSWFASIWQHSAKAFARTVILRDDGVESSSYGRMPQGIAVKAPGTFLGLR